MSELHPSHKTRMALDASSYDEICTYCGATDRIGGWGALAKPCPKAPEPSAPRQEGVEAVDKADAWDAIVEKNRKIATITAALDHATRRAEEDREHIRKQADDIMALGRLVYDQSDPPVEWKARAEAAEARVIALEQALEAIADFNSLPAVQWRQTEGRSNV